MFASSSSDGGVEIPTEDVLRQLLGELKVWQDVINGEAEQFAGNSFLARQEELKNLFILLDQCTDISIELFTRHHKLLSCERTPSMSAMIVTNDTCKLSWRMAAIMQALDEKLATCSSRVRGENGTNLNSQYIITK